MEFRSVEECWKKDTRRGCSSSWWKWGWTWGFQQQLCSFESNGCEMVRALRGRTRLKDMILWWERIYLDLRLDQCESGYIILVYLGTMFVSVYIGMLIKKRDIFDKSVKFSETVTCGTLYRSLKCSRYFSQFCISEYYTFYYASFVTIFYCFNWNSRSKNLKRIKKRLEHTSKCNWDQKFFQNYSQNFLLQLQINRTWNNYSRNLTHTRSISFRLKKIVTVQAFQSKISS